MKTFIYVRKKPDTKSHTLCDPTYMRCLEESTGRDRNSLAVSRGWGRRTGRWCLAGAGGFIGDDEQFGVGDNCTTSQNAFNATNGLKMLFIMLYNISLTTIKKERGGQAL